MKTALCFTPDLSFFRPAVFTAASLIAQGDAGAFDIFIVCEPSDVAPGFERLDPGLRSKIKLLTLDFSPIRRGPRRQGAFFARCVPPPVSRCGAAAGYPRLISIDADMIVARPGLAKLAELDLEGFPLAAALDMIFLMDCKGDALARQFQASRRSLGLDLATPYFNAGLMAIDRAQWRAAGPDRARDARIARGAAAVSVHGAGCAELADPGALCKAVAALQFHGRFFPHRPRERKSSRSCCISSTARNPGSSTNWRGEARFSHQYKSWFKTSPWPDWPTPPSRCSARARKPAMTPLRRRFAERLEEFLARTALY